MTYEELQMHYDTIFVEEMELSKVNGLKGLYVDGCIAIDKNLTEKEKGCICAEEIGHHLTSVGNILKQDDSNNRKQEFKARLIAYDIKIGLTGIIESYEAGCQSIFAMAEYLDATEQFLLEALDCYKKKYGLCVKVDNYTIYFEPSLGVMKMF